MNFSLKSGFSPTGDQPEAIEELTKGIRSGRKDQTLLGVTGSGKTFTMANVIQNVNMPTLIISHNKTLAAQLYQEFKDFFPENAVEYFVSFYDYYQPEAYIPSSDTYIEKSSDINEEIDRLRLKATSALMSRKDVIIVASVSCIYNIGSPESYEASSTTVSTGGRIERNDLFRRFLDMQYVRNDMSPQRAAFRVRGDVIDIFPSYEKEGIRIETFGDSIEKLSWINPVSGCVLQDLEHITIFPAKHFVTTNVSMKNALKQIENEMNEQVSLFKKSGKLVEADRLEKRTRYDMEMLAETGYINGIENYSRILDGREPGSRPFSLLDFFPEKFLTIIDESHISIPQIRGMYNGDRARKGTLVEHGFRIPCALDNRPLKFNEFEELTDFVLYSSATPSEYELRKSGGIIAEQIIRPTGLVDPPIDVLPASSQVDDLIDRLRNTAASGGRALVTTLTKKMSEDLCAYLEELDFRVKYLHSEIETLERTEILHGLRRGDFDILIGINLLREGLDLPEVTLVAILDADKEGFLRSERSIIQTAGRAARNKNGRIILYADKITNSIRKALEETDRRRKKQLEHNRIHNITPETVVSRIKQLQPDYSVAENSDADNTIREGKEYYISDKKSIRYEHKDIQKKICNLEKKMKKAAEKLDFEKAARLRDTVSELREFYGS